MLRPSRAAALRSSRAAPAALSSRLARHAARLAICDSSASCETVMNPSPVSGEGADSVNTLTPTTGVSPDSMAASLLAFDSTRRCFM